MANEKSKQTERGGSEHVKSTKTHRENFDSVSLLLLFIFCWSLLLPVATRVCFFLFTFFSHFFSLFLFSNNVSIPIFHGTFLFASSLLFSLFTFFSGFNCTTVDDRCNKSHSLLLVTFCFYFEINFSQIIFFSANCFFRLWR